MEDLEVSLSFCLAIKIDMEQSRQTALQHLSCTVTKHGTIVNLLHTLHLGSRRQPMKLGKLVVSPTGLFQVIPNDCMLSQVIPCYSPNETWINVVPVVSLQIHPHKHCLTVLAILLQLKLLVIQYLAGWELIGIQNISTPLICE